VEAAAADETAPKGVRFLLVPPHWAQTPTAFLQRPALPVQQMPIAA
jgi:hypothetical protein